MSEPQEGTADWYEQVGGLPRGHAEELAGVARGEVGECGSPRDPDDESGPDNRGPVDDD